MYRTIISSIAIVFCGLTSGSTQAQWMPVPPPGGYVRPMIELEPGDVILSVNGCQLFDLEGFMDAVRQSREVMHLTVRDGRTGRNLSLATRLSRGGHRFGVRAAENNGDGVIIRQVFFNTAAQRCWPCNGAFAGDGTPPQMDLLENPDGSREVVCSGTSQQQSRNTTNSNSTGSSTPIRRQKITY